MYYTISPKTDDEGMKQAFYFDDDDIEDIEFDEGKRLYPSDHPTADDDEKEPEGMIKLNLKRSKGTAPLPTFLSQPTPLMSKDMLDTLYNAGINNLDAYPAELYYPDGSPAGGEYYIINVVGLVAAADLEKSVYDPEQSENLISMGFDSLAIDPEKSKGFLMFRLAESITEIIVHEKVVKAVQEAQIPLVKFYKTEDIVIL